MWLRFFVLSIDGVINRNCLTIWFGEASSLLQPGHRARQTLLRLGPKMAGIDTAEYYLVSGTGYGWQVPAESI